MAPTGKNSEARHKKGQIIGSRHSHRERHKRLEFRRRMQSYQSSNIQKWVRRLLNIGKHKQGTENKKLTVSQNRWLQRLLRKYQDHLESSNDNPANLASAQESECTVAITPSNVMETTNSSRSTTSESSASNVSQQDNAVQSMTLAQSIENMRNLLKNEPVVQIINSCFKAGVDEGKRRAKTYIQNVLAYGLGTGYLIPGDLRDQSARTLVPTLESKRADAESRLRRRRARRGEDIPPNVKRKDLRRGTSTWTTKSKAQGGDTVNAIATKKRGRKSKSNSPRTSSNPRGSRAEKTSGRRGRKEDASAKRKAVEKKRSRHDRDDTRDKSSRGRASTSARDTRRKNRSKSRRVSENRDAIQSPRNETNQKVPWETLKSTLRSKSVPTQQRASEPRGSVESEVEEDRVGETNYDYDATGQDA